MTDAGDSAKLVSKLREMASREVDTLLAQRMMIEAANWIEQHATPSSATSEAVATCEDCGGSGERTGEYMCNAGPNGSYDTESVTGTCPDCNGTGVRPHPIERQAGEFVSVPREPTTEMIYAGIEAMKKAPDLVGIVDNLLPEAVDCYKAMLAAAPAQAAQGDGVTVGMAEAAIQSLAAQAVDAGEDLKMGYRVTQTRMVKALEAAQAAQPK